MRKAHKNSQGVKNYTKFTPVNQFKLLQPFEEEDASNGLYFDSICIPEEVLQNIFNHVPPKNLLDLTLVCKKWCNIIKSEYLWMHIYNRFYPNKAKKLPWYVFYCYFTTNNFVNLLKNGNGQEQFNHWEIVKNGGDKFKIEPLPCGSDALPLDVPDFNGHISCFSTSYQECTKIQEICLAEKRLLRYIINKFMPHIYVSEWVAGRSDCGCMYKLSIRGYGEKYTRKMILHYSSPVMSLFHKTGKTIVILQCEGKEWTKVEIPVTKYPPNVMTLIFEHTGRDTQFWKGHYGSKMAGGVVRFDFDSIQPLGDRDETET